MSLFERWLNLWAALCIVVGIELRYAALLSVGLYIVPVIAAQVLRRQVLAFEVVKAGSAS